MTYDLRLVANGGLTTETGDDGSDTTGIVTATATTTTFAALARNVSIYRSIPLTIGNDFYIENTFNITSGASSAAAFIAFGATLGDQSIADETSIFISYNASNLLDIYLRKTEASSVTNTNTGASFSLATSYYSRLICSSAIGGQYGGSCLQVFSDLGRTTLVASKAVAYAAARAAYNYLYPIQTQSAAIAATITGTSSNITGFTPAVGVNLTTYTTSGAALAAYANIATGTALAANVNQTISKDDGVGHWTGNFVSQGVINLVSNSASINSIFCAGALSNSVTHGADTTSHQVGIISQSVTPATSTLKIHELNGASEAFSASSITITATIPLWYKLRRDTAVGTYGTYYAQFYYDPAYLVPFGSEISLAARESVNFRYSIPVQSYSTGSANTTMFTVGGVSYGVPATVTVNQTTETDIAQHITVSQGVLVVAVNQTTETDIAQTVTATQDTTITIGQATESDLAQPIAMYAATTIAVGVATEIDLAQIILLSGAPQTVSVGQVTETDAAQVISSPTPITVAMGQASEIDLALTVTAYASNTIALGQVSETDAAFPLTVVFGVTETWSINLKHPTTGLALTGLGNTVVKFEAYQESTGDWFNSVTNALQTAQPTPLALLEDISGSHNGRYAAAATIGVFDAWMVLHIYWDYDASDGRGTVRRHKWARVRYNSGVEWLGGLTVPESLQVLTATPAAISGVAAATATAVTADAKTLTVGKFLALK